MIPRLRAALDTFPVLREAATVPHPNCRSTVSPEGCFCPQPVLALDPLPMLWVCQLCGHVRTTDEAMPRRTV